MYQRTIAAVGLVTALLSGGSGCGPTAGTPEARVPVSGSVTVAGKAAAGLIVRFHLSGGMGDARTPGVVETLTDAAGEFRVSQNAPGDGLAPGVYTVTFFWPPGGDPDAPVSADQLKGRYNKPEKSQFHVEVPAPSQPLPPFNLT